MRKLKIAIIVLAMAVGLMVCMASSMPGKVVGKFWHGDPTDMHYYLQLRRGMLRDVVEVSPDVYESLAIGGEYTH